MKEFSQSTGEALPADTHTDAGDEWEVRLDKTGRGGGVRLFLAGEIEAAA